VQYGLDFGWLFGALSDLVRVYQFRDRDRICCYDVSVTQCYALEALARRSAMTLNDLATARSARPDRFVDVRFADTVSNNTPTASSSACTILRLPNSVAVKGTLGSMTTTFTDILLASSDIRTHRRRHASSR